MEMDGKGKDAKELKDGAPEEESDDDFRRRAGFQGRLRRFGSNQLQLMKTVKTYGWLNLISDGRSLHSIGSFAVYLVNGTVVV
jgi:hypothetical protein